MKNLRDARRGEMRDHSIFRQRCAMLAVSAFPIIALSRPANLLAVLFACLPLWAAASPCPALLDRQAPRLQDEKPQNLCQYAGKVVVVVNTASYCGYTPQYKGLEALHAHYAGRGLVVLGFPSNDFGGQEPGSNRQIADFCENTFGVKFPMFAKSHVAPSAGADTNPLFVALRERTGEAPHWNFHKYVISRDGQTVQSFPTKVEPQSAAFLQAIEQMLEQKAP